VRGRRQDHAQTAAAVSAICIPVRRLALQRVDALPDVRVRAGCAGAAAGYGGAVIGVCAGHAG